MHNQLTRDELETALATARAQEQELRLRILNSPYMLTTAQIAQKMTLTESVVLDLHRSGQILGIAHAEDIRFPEWQLDPYGMPHKGVKEVIEVLGNGWPPFHFFISQQGGESHLMRLLRGEVNDLVTWARGDRPDLDMLVRRWASASYAQVISQPKPKPAPLLLTAKDRVHP